MMNFYEVFVYGTLRKGGSNHYYLEDSPCLQENVWLKGYCLYDYEHWYPYMLTASAEEQVKGELYRINQEKLEQLNILEDVEHHLYRLVFLSDHNFYTYLKYDLQVDGMPKVKGGDWITYIRAIRS